jgi:DNA-binding ferritin-like protein
MQEKKHHKNKSRSKSILLTTRLRKTQRAQQNNKRNCMVVHKFLELLNMVKLYHWKTHSYSQHKATDELYGKLSENIDRFVEVLMGKSKNRIQMLDAKMRLYDLDTKQELREHILEYRDFLINLDQVFHPRRDSDLFSIRDDLLADINQFLYLWTFDQP